MTTGRFIQVGGLKSYKTEMKLFYTFNLNQVVLTWRWADNWGAI